MPKCLVADGSTFLDEFYSQDEWQASSEENEKKEQIKIPEQEDTAEKRHTP